VATIGGISNALPSSLTLDLPLAFFFFPFSFLCLQDGGKEVGNCRLPTSFFLCLMEERTIWMQRRADGLALISVRPGCVPRPFLFFPFPFFGVKARSWISAAWPGHMSCVRSTSEAFFSFFLLWWWVTLLPLGMGPISIAHESHRHPFLPLLAALFLSLLPSFFFFSLPARVVSLRQKPSALADDGRYIAADWVGP